MKQTLNNAGTVNKVNIQPSKSIKMTDDSMEPLIPKGATLHFEEIDEIKMVMLLSQCMMRLMW